MQSKNAPEGRIPAATPLDSFHASAIQTEKAHRVAEKAVETTPFKTSK